MAYPVNDIADFVIEYANSKGNPVNNLKLQKILYYLEARFLFEGKGVLFDEPIEKWRYGPVIPEVYHRFKHYGAEDINRVPVQFNFMSLLDESDESPNTDLSVGEGISPDDKKLVEETVNQLLSYNPFKLVNETHKHPAWRNFESHILSGGRNLQYTDDEILEDFSHNPSFRLWETP
ncbi:hypothetical protein AV656_08620 [Bhargavaea cecembensis]|uniref:Antitoxin SocA-like Panacea domain-containing protein n=1 Tax=Bhargavaea cecembensis TaxID=394098 RepID=A0A161RG45_9BACL|nr:type II toxin-antitoxin system antitoxin SocA domain-containing protein [Bhargavaea cecembensis]KZE38952.1 hypothetical protein AV656_08620 [Bhargavaea cecembensis]